MIAGFNPMALIMKILFFNVIFFVSNMKTFFRGCHVSCSPSYVQQHTSAVTICFFNSWWPV